MTRSLDCFVAYAPRNDEGGRTPFQTDAKSRFKLCMRCICRNDRVQWRAQPPEGKPMTPTHTPPGFEPQSPHSHLPDPTEAIYSRQNPDALNLGHLLACPRLNARRSVR